MPQVNPLMLLQNQFQKLVKLPSFQTLSPSSQQTFRAAAQDPKLLQTPATSAAIHEAVNLGLLPKFTTQTLLEEAGIIGGAALLGPEVGNLVGGGAAPAAAGSAAADTGAGVGIGETGAVTGLSGSGLDAGAALSGGAAAGDVTALGPVAASGGTTAATVPTALSSAGVPAGTAAAGTGFGAALKAALPSILPSVIGGGLGLAGAVVGANATTSAAKIAAAEQQKALDQAYAIYQQNVAREKPFVGLGTSSLSALAQGMGLPDPNAAPATPAAPTYPYTKTTPAATPPPTAGGGVTRTAQPGDTITGQAVPRQSLADLSTLNTVPRTGGTTRVLNPQTGQIYPIPNEQVAAAQQDGGVLV